MEIYNKVPIIIKIVLNVFFMPKNVDFTFY